MLELFSHYILHFERYFILSRQSVLIIQWSIVGLAALYALTYHPKINQRAALFYSGVVLRVILLAGVSIELFHQVKATDFTSAYLASEGQELLPLLHFFMYGYVLLAAFHYMLMLRDNNSHGMFYTFDLAVVSMPIVQVVFSFFSYWKRNPDYMEKEEIMVTLGIFALILLLLVTLNLLFFKLYWKQNKRLLGIYYTLVIGLLVLLLMPYPEEFAKDYGALFPYTTYLTLSLFLMSYHLFLRSKKKFPRVKKWLTIGTVLFFTALLNPVCNMGDAAFAFSKPTVADQADYVGEHISSEKAIQILKSFFPTDEKMYLSETNMDLHYFYQLKTASYEAEVDEVSQMIQNYRYVKEPKGKTLTDKEYKEKSIHFLEKNGRILNKNIEVKVSKENNQTVVQLFLKNQFAQKKKEVDFNSAASFYWEKETLMGFSETPSVYKMESLPQVHITKKDIYAQTEKVLHELKQPVTAYQITKLDINSLIGSRLQVETKEGIQLEFNTASGALEEMTLPRSLGYSLHDQNLRRQLLTLLGAEHVNQKEQLESKDDLTFIYRDSAAKYEFSLFEDQDGMTADSYQAPRSFPYTYRDGKKAYEKAAAGYKDIIYKKRTKPIIATKGGESFYAWLVIIQPFGSNRHDAYVVDAETNEVMNLYEQ
ncbi:hypothetical protein [Bacillus atrophaeus]|uniref:hypothetical protein n=1 Tax=Bacillus atrophaeus TaxID=1452 RepID=UPI00227F8AB6|nr:hypothetical protein [Bacillus atrophaeus]MCY8856828.1 hypothetical protein [Bacillus atrophaeus]